MSSKTLKPRRICNVDLFLEEVGRPSGSYTCSFRDQVKVTHRQVTQMLSTLVQTLQLALDESLRRASQPALEGNVQ